MRRRFNNPTVFSLLLCGAIVFGWLSGCGKKDDPVAKAEKNDKDKPGMVAIKDIAKEAYIYGLPMVMNYARHARVLRRQELRQYKAPFNRSTTRPASSRYQRHGRSSRPTATRPTRSSGWTCGRSRWCLACRRSRRAATTPCSSSTCNTYNYGYIGSRATGNERRQLHGRRPRLEGRDAARASRRSSPRRPPSRWPAIRTQLFNPGDMPNVEKVQAGYKVQPLSAFLKQPAPPAAPKIDFAEDRQGAGSRPTSSSTWTSLLQFCPPVGPEDEGDPRQARHASASGRARRSSSRISRRSTRRTSGSGMKEGDEKIDK